MHQLLPLKLKIGLIILVAAVAAAAVSAFTQSWLIIFTVVSIVDAVFVYGLLRSWPLTSRLTSFVPYPHWLQTRLSGNWRGEIHSSWRRAEGDPPLPPIAATMTIYQNWHDFVVLVETTKMRGRSIHAFPQYDPEMKTLNVRYFFETLPSGEVSQENPPQKLGCAIATYQLSKPNELRITYTNERGPGGEIVLARTPGRGKRR